MRIIQLHLLTADLVVQRDFYTQVLGLVPVEEAGALALQAGSTRLVFRPTRPTEQAVYHFAFDIPQNCFQEAKALIAGRVPLLRDASGADAFSSENWNSDSVYFRDPAGNILEFIARHGLANDSDQPFTERSILSVSEIGLATDNVVDTVSLLQAELGAGIYDGAGSETFTAVGDEHGLLIVVKRGRIWFPDTGQAAELAPMLAGVSEGAGRRHSVFGPPYQVA